MVVGNVCFEKFHSNGNSFIIIDERYDEVHDRSALARDLCDERISVGADSVLFLAESRIADIRMRIFEQDGSESDMCGNGARCVALYLQRDLVIETNSGTVMTRFNGDEVEVTSTLQSPEQFLGCEHTSVSDNVFLLEHCGRQFYALSVGEPHLVIFGEVDDLDFLRDREMFPFGINLNIVEILDGRLRVRTYERGVWDFTSSCGTGAMCSAFVARQVFGFSDEITVENEIGEQSVTVRGNQVSSTAYAVRVCRGVLG